MPATGVPRGAVGSSLVRRVSDFLERQAAGDEAQRLRARFLFLLLAGGVALSVGLALFNFATGTWPEAVSALVGAVVCGLVFAVWAKTGRMGVVTTFYGLVQLPLFAGAAVAMGRPSYLAWLALTPMTVLFFAGRRAGAVWLAMTLAAGGLAAGAFVLFDIPVHHEPSLLLELSRALLFVPVIVVIGFLFETVRLRTMASLRAAREAAEEANRQKDRFLANVSHEIRTPLNGVLGMTEVLLASRELPPPDVVRDHLEVIQQSGRTLRVLIDDLLDLARSDAGQLSLSPGPFEPSRVLEEVVALYAPAAATRKLSLRLESTVPRDATVVGDRVRVAQILSNLVANAVKFTPSGEVRVEASAALADGQWTLNVKVRDTGPGITREEAERLFQPFAQLTTARGLGGTGLGLAISRQLARLMGGELALESGAGGGSTFALRLTLPHHANSGTPVPAPVAGLAPLRGRVLVVDDNAINLRVAVALLEKSGLTVLQSTDGEGPLALLAAEAIDLVMMDRHMPGMDGIEATRRLRERERQAGARRTPVVALTASALQEELDACRAAGMDDVLSKPVSMEALQRVLRAHLAAREGDSSLSTT